MGSTYLPSHSLFELPIVPLQNMHDSAPPFCHSSINAPIQNWLSVNIRMKRLHATLKSLPQYRTGCCSISDGENESDTKVGLEEGFPTGCTLWKYTSLTQRVADEEAIGGAGGYREVARILPNPDVGQDNSTQ